MRWKPIIIAVVMLTAVTLTGCKSRSVISVEADGNITGYEEITFTKGDYANDPQLPTDCDGILAYSANLAETGLPLPERVEAVQYPSGVEEVDDEVISCRFYAPENSEILKTLSQTRVNINFSGDNTVFHIGTPAARSLRNLISSNLQKSPVPIDKKLIAVRMPSMVSLAEVGEKSISSLQDTDALFKIDDFNKPITVISTSADISKTTQAANKQSNLKTNTQSIWDNPNTQKIILGIVVVVLLLLVSTLVIVLLPRVIRGSKAENDAKSKKRWLHG